jgi:hypothetical protein
MMDPLTSVCCTSLAASYRGHTLPAAMRSLSSRNLGAKYFCAGVGAMVRFPAMVTVRTFA